MGNCPDSAREQGTLCLLGKAGGSIMWGEGQNKSHVTITELLRSLGCETQMARDFSQSHQSKHSSFWPSPWCLSFPSLRVFKQPHRSPPPFYRLWL